MPWGISRRSFLGGALSALAGTALAGAPEVSPRPRPRVIPVGGAAPEIARRASPAAVDLIARAQLGGRVGFVVADARTGVFLESRDGAVAMPPASVAKSVTALYALTILGEDHRFVTRILATGPVTGGVVQGDLVLVGGGDPEFHTDALAGMVARLKAAGVSGVSGRLLVHAGALPYAWSIDPAQPEHLGYNPSVSGLNLNYNRVHFQWERAGTGWSVSMDARSDTLRPAVTVAKMAVVNRQVPTYTYEEVGGTDAWTVASEALGNGGSRWLPVRRPDLYAGEVMQVLAAAHGIRLPRAQPVAALPPGATVLVEHASAPLSEIVTDMLKYSTNLTAEAIGLAASLKRGVPVAGLADSAAAMSDWMRRDLDARSARFVDHSGLGDQSRISTADMVRMLVRVGPGGLLHRHLKEMPPPAEAGGAGAPVPYRVHAKTGSLNFVSTLAGYVTTADGTPLAFAIFTGDTARRAGIAREDMERPDGAKAWARRSRLLQQQLIERWAGLYAA